MAEPLKSFDKTVSATGTAERLISSATQCSSYTISAKPGNTGDVYLGNSDVSTSDPPLQPGDSISWAGGQKKPTADLREIWVDVDTNGEGVDVWYTPA